MSQQDLALAADVTPSFLSLVENEKRKPSLTVLHRIARALEVPEEVLVWEAVELPDDLAEKDRRLCEIAKLIVRRMWTQKRGKAASAKK